MTAGTIAPTVPYCRACGWDFVKSPNLDSDDFCDACGDSLDASGAGALVPPVAPVATPGSGTVSFAFTVNPAADSTESSESVDGALAVWSAWAADTSPTVVSAVAGTIVGLRVRSVVNGIPGPYTEQSDTTGV